MTTKVLAGLTVAHSSAAEFRAWGSALSGMLAAVGLIRSTDSGQIDWSTVVLPSANTAAGYEMWHFADSLQSVAPVYLKFEYGTASNTTFPAVWLTAGVSSDGAGNITGLQTTRRASVLTTGSTLTARACHTDGFFGIAFGYGSGPSLVAYVSRPVLASGVLSPSGFTYISPSGTTSAAVAQSISFDVSAVYPNSVNVEGGAAFMPFGLQSASVGTKIQVARNFGRFPSILTLRGVISYIQGDIGAETTADVAVEGTTKHKYIGLDSASNYAAYPSQTSYCHAMLWE